MTVWKWTPGLLAAIVATLGYLGAWNAYRLNSAQSEITILRSDLQALRLDLKTNVEAIARTTDTAVPYSPGALTGKGIHSFEAHGPVKMTWDLPQSGTTDTIQSLPKPSHDTVDWTGVTSFQHLGPVTPDISIYSGKLEICLEHQTGKREKCFSTTGERLYAALKGSLKPCEDGETRVIGSQNAVCKAGAWWGIASDKRLSKSGVESAIKEKEKQ